jgi:hypothetical protein
MTSVLSKLAPSSEVDLTAKKAGINALFTHARREIRRDEVRSAEYTPFPRIRAEQRPRVGFTRDISPLGMCLGVDVPENVGSLIRIEVRRLDGRSIGATIGRVAWCSSTRDGRYWLGLDLLCEADGVTPRELPQQPEPTS